MSNYPLQKNRNHRKYKGIRKSVHFDSYLSQFRRRYKFQIIATALAAVIFSVLVLSLGTAVLKNSLADSNWLYYPARALLLVLPIVLLIALLWRPYQQFKRSAGAAELESAVPEFDGRVDTYLDMKRRNVRSPFVGLLAKDAARTASKRPVSSILPTSEVMGPIVASFGMFMLAGWLFTSMPLDWRASIKQLWMGWFVSDILPDRSIALAPGDTKIRIGDTLLVSATLDGFESNFAELHVSRNASNSSAPEWETVEMIPQSDGSFSFTLYGVSDPLDYYVSAAFTESDRAHVDVVVPAKITTITHRYTYPEWTRLEPQTTNSASDINAVAGTMVDIIFSTDKPLQQAALLHNDIKIDATNTADNSYSAQIEITEDGEYQLLELLDNDQIPLSSKFRIAIIEDAKPTVAFKLPGGDWSATPIEEVAVAVTADDDFTVESVTLNYSVNGAEWEQVQLDATNDFEHLFMLEEFYSEKGGPLMAGDLISYYAEAADREQLVSTDMMFIDVRPFERRFTQSQQSGGGGGGGESQQEQEISQRQKEILISTFNLIKDAKSKEATLIDPADTATLLSDLQNTLADQAVKLAERAEARQLLNNDPDIARFVEYMQEAAESMRPSADSLAILSFEEAVKHQQKALQYLKRAESIFNDITINQNQSGGGGGGSGASQDMAEMYELEMDLAKNQYETPDSVPEGGADPQQQASEDAFEKLKDLAKRQQQLAEAAANKEQLTEAERWQQEKLRRELEELKKELEQLQREQSQTAQSQQGQQQSSSGQSQSENQSEGEGQSGSQNGGQNGEQSSSQQQAMQNLEEAIQELKATEENAANLTPEERRQALQNASEKLRQSLEQTADARQQELQQQISDAADALRDLNQQQEQTAEQLREAMRRAMEARKENRYESGLNPQQEQALAEQKRQMQRDLESIKQQIEDASKRYSEQAPLTTERLEQALTELDTNQTSELMGISGDMIEEGMAPQAALREERISEALRNLQTDLFESSSLAAAETGTGTESDITAADATRAIQQLRQALTDALAQAGEDGTGSEVAELQSLERGQQGAESEQNGQGEGAGEEGEGNGQGQRGNSPEGNAEGSNQNGSSQSGSGQSGSGQSGRRLSAGPGSGQSSLNDLPINGGQEQLIEESITQLQQLAGDGISELSTQTQQDLQDLARQLLPNNGEENNRRIDADVRLLLRQLEQLELQIYNDSNSVETTRSKAQVDDPKGFDQQAADYFRRLSEPKGS